MLSLGLCVYWFIAVALPPGEGTWVAGAWIAALLLVHGWRWRTLGAGNFGLLALIAVNWQVVAMVLPILAPHRGGLIGLVVFDSGDLMPLLLPLAFLAAVIVLVSQPPPQPPQS